MWDHLFSVDTGDYKERLGARIRAQRGNESLAAVAKRTKLSVSLLSNLERGIGNPTLDTLLTIAKAFGTDLDDLLPSGDFVTQTHEQPPVAVRRIARRLSSLQGRDRKKALRALNSVLDAVKSTDAD